jgi:tetratricopeptide (TPR) repeat protein
LIALAATLALLGATDVELLKENLARVERSIEETETLLARTPTAKYVPELRFRLCELTVEKSRILYGLQAAQHPDDQGPLVSPEVRLLKEKAVSMYARMLRELPKYGGNDKVRFYLAHEQRELGRFDDMVETLGQLVKKHPKSPLAEDAELILGDHFFDKTDLDEAEKHYRAVLKKPSSPAHDLARYKLGWIWVNRGEHAKAIPEFEAVITGRSSAKDDSKRVVDARREALVDLVYSYTEVKPAKGALAYFERLADSSSTYAVVLDKLAARYLVKQQPENAVQVFRKLLSLRADPDRDEERALALYDAIKDTSGKVLPQAQDVSYLVRAAVQVRKSVSLSESERKEKLGALEQVARDLSTKLHLQAQKRDDRRLFVEAGAAYAEYLSLFRPRAHATEVMKNRADALYAAHDYTGAARQFEALARASDGSDKKLHEEATYGALVAYRASVGDDDKLEHLNRFQIVDARQALKRVGAQFVKQYPNNANVADVRFNIARAHFDDGEYKQASDGFMAFALAYPEHKDAVVAGHLALDSLYKTHDYKKLEAAGQQLLASKLPDSFKLEAKKVLQGVEGEAMTDMAIATADKNGGDVVKGLEEIAKNAKDEPTAAKALQGAMLAAREKGDWDKEQAIAQKLIDEHSDSPTSDDLEIVLARRAVDTGRFGEAAQWFEKAADAYEGKKGQDALRAAGNLYVAMGELDKGTQLLAQVAAKLPKAERADLLASLAEEWLQQGETKRAAQEASKAFSVDVNNPRAAAVLAQAAPATKGASDTLAVAEGEPAARGLWYLAEESFDAFADLDGTKLEKKVAAWQELEQQYAQVIQQGAPEWTVASLWRMGLAYQDLAESLAEVPVPKGADKNEVKAAAEEQAGPLRERAEQTFALCVQKADEHGVFTEAAMGCRAKSEDVKVTIFKTSGKGGKSVPAALQKKVDVVKDAQSLNAVALSWLEQGNPAMARLVFSKALEVNKSFAPAEVGMGFALLQLNSPSAAAAAYREALNLEPSNALARGNLAALKCRYGDTSGARAELEQINDKSQLSGPASDPAWKGCVEALSRR